MRTVLMVLVTLAAGLTARAADPAIEQRVRVALALAAATPAPDPEDCGKCRTDLPAARADAVRTGKPIVLFVGTDRCQGRTAADAGAIPVKVPSYDLDSPPTPATARAVVIGVDKVGGTLSIRDTLPADVSAVQLAAAVRAASPPVRKVDWFAGDR